LSWLGIGSSIKSGEIKIICWAQINIDTPNIHIHDSSLSWLGIGPSIKKWWD
jgi:hypothetical protein